MIGAPEDSLYPDFDSADKVHDWKNYASDALKEHWIDMPSGYRILIAACLQNIADQEHWE